MTEEILVLAYEGDMSSPPDAQVLYSAICDANRSVVLNLGALGHLGGAGFGAMVRAQKRVLDRESEVVIAQPTPQFLRSLEALGLKDLFRIFASDEEALAYFQGARGVAGVTTRPVTVGPGNSTAVETPAGDDRE